MLEDAKVLIVQARLDKMLVDLARQPHEVIMQTLRGMLNDVPDAASWDELKLEILVK